jgi:hypothetical protein
MGHVVTKVRLEHPRAYGYGTGMGHLRGVGEGIVTGGEPLYSATQYTSLFYDDFSSYASLAEMANGSGDHTWTCTTPSDGLGSSAWDQHAFLTAGGRASGNAVSVNYQQNAQYNIPNPGDNNSYNPGEMTGAADMMNGQNPDVVILTQWIKNTTESSFKGKLGLRKASGDWTGYTNPPRLVWGTGNSPPQPAAVEECYWEAAWPNAPLDPDTPPYDPGGQHRFTLISSPYTPVSGYMANTGYLSYADWAGDANQTGMPNDGTFYRYTMRLTRAPAIGEGRIEMWANGLKINEWFGDVAGRPEHDDGPLVFLPLQGTGEKLLVNWFFGSEHKSSLIGAGVSFQLVFDEVRVFMPK